MAEGEKLILCNSLCFLSSKSGKTNVKTLKKAVVDFYTGDVLTKTKQQLQKDVEGLNLSVKMPRYPAHRGPDNRVIFEADDIIMQKSVLAE